MFRATARVAPTAKTDRERWFGKLRRSCEIAAAAIFANPGPSGPEEIAETTPFLRAGNIAKPNRYASTVMGSGESGPMGTKCPSAASPVAFWLLCRHGQSNSPPAGGETPCEMARRVVAPHARKKAVSSSPPHPPPSGAPSPIPSVAARHLPLIRGVGPQGEGFSGGSL